MKYALATLKHKWYVFQACRLMHVPLWRAIVHDWSKFACSELPHYDRQFFGDKGDPAGFAAAWLHHQNHNPHHWEYWITRSGHAVDDNDAAPLPMPETYIREMIADWMGASKAYTGSWRMEKWLEINLPIMRLHPDTRAELGYLLAQHGHAHQEWLHHANAPKADTA